MSKAFTRETDDEHDDDAPRPLGAELPPGVRNYMTPAGAARLRGELDRLAHAPRPETPAALQALERRLAFLRGRLEALEIIDPTGQPPGRVLFGAIVTVRAEDGETRRYRLVGVDEADPPRGDVSWRSPIAAALLGAEVGDVVTLRSPRGDEELEIVAVDHGAGHEPAPR
jgi:transcription elongation factor GreB